ncbi:endonuclease [Streptomyces sp. TRM66268-LWL]|uniref:Endonuclease n=1 Tax=Streptomyces polyasparticus TaxID=2767826 RepID=A0ABR7SLI2_9ACTN|nr:endonuclease [Streptomyces polyasparticus]MBC9716340.1 endonuclease [Streptomyces polyasparticus]
MPAPRTPRRWKPVALATAAVLVGLMTPALTASPAAATTTAYDSTYYKDAIGKSGTALKSSLHTIIKNQRTISYSAVWEALKVTDQDPNNSGNVILLYSGISRSKSLNGGNVGNWNREHVWAQSHGSIGTSNGPGTDLHHLRPEDVQVNSIRGNLDFDLGGSSFTNSGGSLVDADSFQPRSAVRGDVARMILYMTVRYEGDDAWADLEPNDRVNNGSNPLHGRLSVLKAWNEQDPPDAFEERRNELIHGTYQGNRNPFIDHPEWVEAIW